MASNSVTPTAAAAAASSPNTRPSSAKHARDMTTSSSASPNQDEIVTDEYHNGFASTSPPPASTAVVPRTSPIALPNHLQLDRVSFVRMLTQTLQTLGYSSTASSLEHESGIELESRDITLFRTDILRGDWNSARIRIERLGLTQENRREIHRILMEQQYITLVEAAILESIGATSSTSKDGKGKEKEQKSNGVGNGFSNHSTASSPSTPSSSGLMRAVQFLQSELVPLYTDSSSSTPSKPHPHLFHLTSLFTCSTIASLHSTYHGSCVFPSTTDSNDSERYSALFQRLAAYLPSNTFQQGNPLMSLVERAVKEQVAKCHFHREGAYTFDLNQQHQCALTLPTAPLLTLADHSDEVLFVSFSHPHHGDLRIATCSKDRTIKVFALRSTASSHRASKTSRSSMETEEHKSEIAHHSNGTSRSKKHASNGASSSSSSSSAAASSHALDFVCISTMHSASSSAPSTPSSTPDSPSPSSSHGPAFSSVMWSCDNEYLLASNGVEACVFHVEHGICILSVGAKAIDNLAAAAVEGDTTVSASQPTQSAVASASAHSSPAPPSAGAAAAPLSASSGLGWALARSGASPQLVFQSPYSPPLLPAGAPGAAAASARGLFAQMLASSRFSSGGGSIPDSQASSEHENVQGHAEPVTSCAWCEDGRTFVTGSADRRIILWDLSGEILDVWVGEMITDIVIVGTRMLACTPHNRCIVLQIRDRRIEEISSFHESIGISSVSLSADARYALVSVMRPAELHLWDLGNVTDANAEDAMMDGYPFIHEEESQNGVTPTEHAHVASSTPAAASSSPSSSAVFPPVPSSSHLLSPHSAHSSSSSSLPVFLRRYTGFRAHRYIVRSCFGGPSNHLVVSGSEDGLVYIWQRDTGKLLVALRGHSSTVNTIAACQHDGRYLLASASDDRTVKLWQIESHAQHEAKS